MKIFDSHIHLDHEDYRVDESLDVASVITRSMQRGVVGFITIGSSNDLTNCKNAIELARKYPFVWASTGVHPLSASLPFDENYTKLLNFCKDPRVVAIGETGLDFYKMYATAKDQKAWFEAQIEISYHLNKPLIIHCREAAEDILDLLRHKKNQVVGGIFHCYAEDYDFYKKIKELNFKVSFPGIITFKNKNERMKEAARKIPVEDILLETDGPYLAPVPYRGKTNESFMIYEVLKVLSAIKGIDIEELSDIILQNTLDLFSIKLPKSLDFDDYL